MALGTIAPEEHIAAQDNKKGACDDAGKMLHPSLWLSVSPFDRIFLFLGKYSRYYDESLRIQWILSFFVITFSEQLDN